MNSRFINTVVFFMVLFDGAISLKSRGSSCPYMYERTFEGYVPKGNKTAGTYVYIEDVKNLEDCITKCCENKTCNAALMFNQKCYTLDCESNEQCVPILHHNPNVRENLIMVLVKPENKNERWKNILESQDENRVNWKNSCPKLYDSTYSGYLPRGKLSAGNFSYIREITNLKDCTLKCCDNDNCNVAILRSDKCYNVECKSSELCIPTLFHNITVRKSLSMVLVKPVDHGENWKNILNRFNEPADNILLPEIPSLGKRPTISTVTFPKLDETFGHIKLSLNNLVNRNPSNKTLNFVWTQIEGPSKLEFQQTNKTAFDIQKLILGNYVIKLNVKEEDNATNFSKNDDTEDATEVILETTT